MQDLISTAIEQRWLLRVVYPPGERILEPHCYGRGRDGQLLLRSFQHLGASESNEHVDWKLMRLDRFVSIEIAAYGFDGPRPGYNPNDKVMTGGIIARL